MSRARKPKPYVPSEKVEQAGIIALIRALGGYVWELSQRRATQQTPGIGDLYCVVPARAGEFPPAIALWVEAKRSRGGRVSPAQKHFQQCCALALAVHVTGSLAAVEQWAIERGLLQITPVGGYIIDRKGRMVLPVIPLAFGKKV